MIKIENATYKQRIDNYFKDLNEFLNGGDESGDEEIDFLIPQLGGYIYALQVSTLNKDFVDIVKSQQTQYFEVRENAARMHRLQLKLIYLNNCKVSKDDILDAVQSFDEQTKNFQSEEIDFVLNSYFYTEDGNILFERREWINAVKSLAKFCKWLHTRKEQILSGELVTDDIYDNLEPLEFNLNQTDLVHFFDLLVDADVIKEPENEVHKTKGGFYGKLAKYFTAKGKSINPKSAKTIKANKENKGTPYSQTYYEMLNNLKKTIERKLDI
ncbi:hypothetical protein AB1A65_01540 [Muricauda sp. ANG21]|uniref:hypothetical protein n=1 Tax=Allomuricauda sp. ANG21 TaxID=3042468 RepID=UPI003455D848